VARQQKRKAVKLGETEIGGRGRVFQGA
jgi:hypothetical protein